MSSYGIRPVDVAKAIVFVVILFTLPRLVVTSADACATSSAG